MAGGLERLFRWLSHGDEPRRVFLTVNSSALLTYFSARVGPPNHLVHMSPDTSRFNILGSELRSAFIIDLWLDLQKCAKSFSGWRAKLWYGLCSGHEKEGGDWEVGLWLCKPATSARVAEVESVSLRFFFLVGRFLSSQNRWLLVCS